MTLSLEQRLDFEADPWDPQPGDKVVGEVVEVTSYEDKFNTGKTYPVVDLLTDADTMTGVRIYGSKTVLCNELRRVDPKPGDRLAVKYLGLQGKAGAEYHNYRVMAEPGHATPAVGVRLAVVPPPADPGDDGSWPDEPLPEDG